jgi:regulator of RNase E activity RraA
LTPDILESIRRFDTCTIANAIERFGVRLRNEGYTLPGLQCVTGGFPRVIGYAVTCRVRSADPPLTGRTYFEPTEWWTAIEKLPAPRIAVIEHVDWEAGGSVVGEVHAAILKAFDCSGVITNGNVRDIPAVAAMDFPMFARGISLSHAYAHIVHYGKPVEIFGLKIQAGDVIFADIHGAISIPLGITPKIPAVAEQIAASERRVIEVCQSADFSPQKLREAIQNNS